MAENKFFKHIPPGTVWRISLDGEEKYWLDISPSGGVSWLLPPKWDNQTPHPAFRRACFFIEVLGLQGVNYAEDVRLQLRYEHEKAHQWPLAR